MAEGCKGLHFRPLAKRAYKGKQPASEIQTVLMIEEL